MRLTKSPFLNGLVDSSTMPLKNWLMISWAPNVIPRVMTPALTIMPARSTPKAARMMVAATTHMTILPIILKSGIRDASMPSTSSPSSMPLIRLVIRNT